MLQEDLVLQCFIVLMEQGNNKGLVLHHQQIASVVFTPIFNLFLMETFNLTTNF